MKYRLFPNLRIKEMSDMVGIYQPLKQEIVYCSYPEWHKLKRSMDNPKDYNFFGDHFKDLYEKKFIVDKRYLYEDEIKNIANNVINSESKISVSYVILTEDCNLACEYCFILGNLIKNNKKTVMSLSTAEKVVDFLSANLQGDKDNPPIVIFYGGEPLLNFEVLEFIINKFNKIECRYFENDDLKFSIVTNGTLVTRNIAKYLSENNVSVSVSIDGNEKNHDEIRRFYNNHGSFNSAINGFLLLQEAGANPSISFTLGNHNLKNISKTMKYFAKILKPSSVGINFQINTPTNEKFVTIKNQSLAVIEAFKTLREEGIYEDRIMRRLNAFIEGSIRLYDCAAYGSQIVCAPDGDLGICHAYLDSKEYFFGNLIKNPNLSIPSTAIENWIRRTPFNMPQCFNCSAISLCGGGCAYEAQNTYGNFWNVDQRYCVHCIDLIDWMIEDLKPLNIGD